MTRSWNRAAWAGATRGAAAPAGGYRVPGRQDVYYWSARNAGGPWAGSGWGGAVYSERPFGGLTATLDVDAGLVTIAAWWAYAQALTLVRVGPDGEAIPVRGTPLIVTGRTRRNLAGNPRLRDGLTGHTAASGTLTWLTGLVDPLLPPQVTTAGRVTAPASGTAAVRFDLDAIPAYGTTRGLWVRTSALAASLALVVTWYDLSSTLVATTTVAPAALSVTQALGAWSWCEFDIVAPSGGQVGQAVLTATGLGAGGRMDFTGSLGQTGDTLDGPYFDGDSYGGAWRGTPGLSGSTLAPVQTIIDAEAPLGVPLVYVLTSSSSPGYAATTQPITLPEGPLHRSRRQGWLTHPGQAKALRVWIRDEPKITNKLEQTAFKVLGRRRKVVVSDTQRGGDEGELTFVAETLAERKALRDMLDDGSPLLLRLPSRYGHPPLWWLSFGDLETAATGRSAERETRTLTVPFTEVDRPSAATRPLVA